MAKARAKKRKHWIQDAVSGSKKGALKRQLKVPKDKTIPLPTLRKAAKAKGKLGQRARFALTVRGFKKTKRKKRAA